MSRNEALMFLNIAHFIDHFFLLIFPVAVIALARDWGLEYGAALALGTPTYVLLALGTVPAGWLGDRYDRSLLMAAFFFGCGVAGLLVALSTGPIQLMAGLALIGLAASLYHPVGLAQVTDLAERAGRALAINGVFGNLGLAGAAVVTGWLCDRWGWRSAFLLPGLVALGAGCWLLLRRAQLGPPSPAAHAQGKANAVAAPRRAQLAVFAVVCVSALFGGLVFNGVTISLPKLFAERIADQGTSLAAIGLVTGMVFTIAAFAQLPVGELLDRYGARRILATLLSAQIVLLALLAQAQGAAAVAIAIALVTLMFAEIPVTSWLLGRYVESRLRSRAISVEYVLSLGVGSGIVPLIAGLHDYGIGFGLQYLGFAVCAAVVFAAACFLPGRAAMLRPAPAA